MDKEALNEILLNNQIKAKPHSDLGLVITIPSYKEEDLEYALDAITNCALPKCNVEVIVVLNAYEGVDEETVKLHEGSIEKCRLKYVNISGIEFHFLMYNDLPPKWSGVGVARKIAMNEASRRLNQVENNRGIIACFDADSSCSENYLVSLVDHFDNNYKTDSVSIKYKHPLEGRLSLEVYDAITQYELHLRYYADIQKWLGLPYGFQTVGSSMAVRAYAYDVIGGMNKRKAGEDFYFLQKFIQRGHHTEVNDAYIIPSPRRSDRVPFGTGRAVGEMLDGDSSLTTYALQSFIDLKLLLDVLPKLYNKNETDIIFILSLIPAGVQEFLEKAKGLENILRINRSTKSFENFVRSFYNWFDAFVIMKYVHHMRDTFYENAPVDEASKAFLRECTSINFDNNLDIKSILQIYRNIDDKGYMPSKFRDMVYSM